MYDDNLKAQGLACDSYISGLKPRSSNELNDSFDSEVIESSESTDEDAEFRQATEKMYNQLAESFDES